MADQEIEKFARHDPERTFSRIEFHVKLSEGLKCLFEVSQVVRRLLALGQHVIDINLHVSIDLVGKHMIDQPLIRCPCIF